MTRAGTNVSNTLPLGRAIAVTGLALDEKDAVDRLAVPPFSAESVVDR